MDLFSHEKPKYKLPKTVRLFEAFSGVGTQAMALKRLTNVEHVGFSEIDKFAIASYKAIHGDVKNYGDITKMVDIPPCDIFTWSFPCTDLSKAGKQKGLVGTRSGLGFEVMRLLHATKEKPKVLLMENVPDLLSPKFRDGWHEMYNEIESMGYTNYVELLNAKNHGVAQNRDRVFMVSILGEYAYEFPKPIELTKRLKDYLEDEVDEKYYLSDKQLSQIANWKSFQNPLDNVLGQESLSPTITTRVAETDAGGISASMIVLDEKEKINKNYVVGNVNPSGFGMNGNVWGGDLAPTITTNKGEGIKILEPRCLNSKVNGKQPSLQDRVYDTDAISTAVTTGYITNVVVGGIVIPEATKQGYAVAQDGDGVYINRPHQKRGVVQKGMIQTLKTSGDDVGVVVGEHRRDEGMRTFKDNVIGTIRAKESGGDKVVQIIKSNNSAAKHQQDLIQHKDDICRTIPAGTHGATPHLLKTVVGDYPLRIRKLTPLECWRLMGINDQDFYKAQTVCSNSQLYKQAGNAIVVNVLVEIFKQMI